MSDYKAVIGLEVHAQLRTRSKMFCACEASYGGEANSRVCPVCLGLPGALPVANREAVRLALRFAHAVSAQIHRHSLWARKNYFYPDLPKGYQISQHRQPLATGGAVLIEPPGRDARTISLERVHLEEDAGKSVHDGFGEQHSGVDFNRCGVPLIEIVSRPEIDSPDEAQLYLERLRAILRVTGVCDAEMQLGSLRCDANVSVHRPGQALGTRVEIKNLNSFRHVRRALAFEIDRQAEVLERGGLVERETRLWDEDASCTRVMRTKEDAEDYRYFPEPDLPPLLVDDELHRDALLQMPELPHERRRRYRDEHALREDDALRLSGDHELGDYYEALLSRAGGEPRQAANWVLGEMQRLLAERDLPITESPVSPERLADLLRMVEAEEVSLSASRDVFREMAEGGEQASEVIDRLGLRQISAEHELRELALAVLAAHAKQVEAYRAGKQELHGFFVGQLMRLSGGRAHPQKSAEMLRELLGAGE